jgi:beta-glucoside operon transcriptional antiterminator
LSGVGLLGEFDVLIKKILNNNVIVTSDEDGCEVVAMGRGIAFGKHNGDDVPREKLDKVYRLSDHEMLEKFKTLLEGLSLDYLDASNAIIEMAEKELGTKLNDSVYISLTDHIHMAVARIREGIPIRNMMLWETRRFYPQEFSLAEKAVMMLDAQFDVDMPEDEAGFIAMHLIDAQLDLKQPMADKILHLIEEISNIVRRTCGIEFDKDSLPYYRFVTHLKFFAQRMFSGVNPPQDDLDEEMEAMVQKKYQRAHECVEKIAAFLARKYRYAVSGDEQFYLMIHIAKIIRKSQE